MRVKVGIFSIVSAIILLAMSSFAFAGFEETRHVTGLDFPTSMAFLPDGNLLVAEQGGDVRVISPSGSLVSTPFVSLDLSFSGEDNDYSDFEKGLLGVAVDPAWSSGERFVYVYYTIPGTQQHRVSRFRASSNALVSDPGFAEDILLSPIGESSDGDVHNGGSMQFGPDGKLYIVMGDSFRPDDAQDLSNLKGTLMRINKDGTIPSDNPFSGANQREEIWLYGLRNPFTFAIDPLSGAMMLNDVGADHWEEVNYVAPGEKGLNFGWPICEGPKNVEPSNCASNDYEYPIFAYDHPDTKNNPLGESITGGTFYHGTNFPSSYVGDYFFGDYVGNWIRRINKDDFDDVSVFLADAKSPIDIDIHPTSGELYYLQWTPTKDGSSIYRVSYTSDGNEPTARFTASPESGQVPLTVSFDASASSDTQTSISSFSWNFGDGSSGSGSSVSHTFSSVGDYVVALTVTDTEGFSDSVEHTITVRQATQTQLSIASPGDGSTFSGGDTITFTGQSSNAPAGSEFSWQVNMHHIDLDGTSHIHPVKLPTVGSSGTLTVSPDLDHPDTDIWYEFLYFVEEPSGTVGEVSVDVHPEESSITVATSPPGLQVTVDGIPRTAPFTADTIVGVERTISVDPVVSSSSGEDYEFVSWSDGGAATHKVAAASTPKTFTATFRNTATGETYPGYAPPVADFTVGPSHVVLDSVSDTSAMLSISVSNDAIWRYGYISYDGAAWTQFEFDGSLDGNWIRDQAAKDISLNPSSVVDGSSWNFVATYSCAEGDIWDCQDRRWQIRQFSTAISASGNNNNNNNGGNNNGGTSGTPQPQCSGDICNIPSATGAVILNPGDNIGAAASNNPAGTLFILNPGVYREQSVTPKANQKFYGRPGAIMNGARKLSSWTQEGSNWWASIPSDHAEVLSQRANSCDATISSLCHLAEDVFFDDRPGTQVGSKGEVTGFKFYIDYGANRVYIAQNPNSYSDIELSYIERAFVGPEDNVVIRGLTIEKYAPINQEGAIETRRGRGTHLQANGNGNNWVIEQNTLSHNHGSAAVFFSGTQFRDNYVHTNGVVGIKPMWAQGATIEGNEFAFNSYAGVKAVWESGGLKSLWSDDLQIVQNYAHDNLGYGLWTDTDVYRTLYDGNLVFRNTNRGIAEEVDFDATIINNVAKFNGADPNDGGWMGAPQILIQNSEGAVVKDNVVVVGTESQSGAGPMGILVVQGDRSDQQACCGGEQPNYFSRDNDVSNNDITYMGSIGNTGIIWSAHASQATNNKFTNNKFHIANTGANVFAWETKGKSFSAWQANAAVSGNTIDSNIPKQSGFARPVVTLTRPNIVTLSPNEPVLLRADISGLEDGDYVGVVIFYLDGVEIARTSHNPYEVYWYYPVSGDYVLTAKAVTVHDEHEVMSQSVSVTVTAQI